MAAPPEDGPHPQRVTVIEMLLKTATKPVCLTDVVGPIIAVKDVEATLHPEVCKTQTRSALALPPEQQVPASISTTGKPLDLVSAPKQSIGADQHTSILAQPCETISNRAEAQAASDSPSAQATSPILSLALRPITPSAHLTRGTNEFSI